MKTRHERGRLGRQQHGEITKTCGSGRRESGKGDARVDVHVHVGPGKAELLNTQGDAGKGRTTI